MIQYPYISKEMKGMINIINKNEIIVRFRSGESKRAIAKALGIARNTVDKYVNEYNQLQQKLSQAVDKTVIAAIQNKICSAPKRKTVNVKRKAFTPECERRFFDSNRTILFKKNIPFSTFSAWIRLYNASINSQKNKNDDNNEVFPEYCTVQFNARRTLHFIYLSSCFSAMV